MLTWPVVFIVDVLICEFPCVFVYRVGTEASPSVVGDEHEPEAPVD